MQTALLNKDPGSYLLSMSLIFVMTLCCKQLGHFVNLASREVNNLVPRAFPLKVGVAGKDPVIGWSRVHLKP